MGALEKISTGGDIMTTLAGAQRMSDAYRDCLVQKNLTGLSYIQAYYLSNNCYLSIQGMPTLTPPLTRRNYR